MSSRDAEVGSSKKHLASLIAEVAPDRSRRETVGQVACVVTVVGRFTIAGNSDADEVLRIEVIITREADRRVSCDRLGRRLTCRLEAETFYRVPVVAAGDGSQKATVETECGYRVSASFFSPLAVVAEITLEKVVSAVRLISMR